MYHRPIRTLLAPTMLGIMLLTFLSLAATQRAAADCDCNQYIVAVDSNVQCSITVCVPVNGGEQCTTYGPGTTTFVPHICGLPNSATIVTACGRVAPPQVGHCRVLPLANGCCAEVCLEPTDIGCLVIHVKRVNSQTCPCP